MYIFTPSYLFVTNSKWCWDMSHYLYFHCWLDWSLNIQNTIIKIIHFGFQFITYNYLFSVDWRNLDWNKCFYRPTQAPKKRHLVSRSTKTLLYKTLPSVSLRLLESRWKKKEMIFLKGKYYRLVQVGHASRRKSNREDMICTNEIIVTVIVKLVRLWWQSQNGRHWNDKINFNKTIIWNNDGHMVRWKKTENR